MKKQILIVDDEPGMRMTLADIINITGFTAATVENGSQALEKVKKQVFDVILMDFKMPGLNGVETFMEIRKLLPDVKVIFITAYYNEQSIKEAMDEGAIVIYQKPLNIPQLLDCIKRAIGNS